MHQLPLIQLNEHDNNIVSQIGNHINYCIADSQLHPWEKLRQVMFYSTKVLKIYKDSLLLNGMLETSDQEVVFYCDRLDKLSLVDIAEILHDQQYLCDFAGSCYVLNLMSLLHLAVHYGGARLNFNSFFVNLYNQNIEYLKYNQNDKLTTYNSQILYILLFDIIDQQPWQSFNAIVQQPMVMNAPEEVTVITEPAIETTTSTPDLVLVSEPPKPPSIEQLIYTQIVALNIDTCNAYFECEENRLIFAEQLSKFINKINDATQKQNTLEFLKQLKISLDFYIELIRSPIININNKTILFAHLLQFSDREIYDAHCKYDLYNLLGICGAFSSKTAKSFKENYKRDLKNKIRSCEQQFAPKALVSEKVENFALASKHNSKNDVTKNSNVNQKKSAKVSNKNNKTSPSTDPDEEFLDSIIKDNLQTQTKITATISQEAEDFDCEAMLLETTIIKAIYDNNPAAVNGLISTESLDEFQEILRALFACFGNQDLKISKEFLLGLKLTEELLNAIIKSKLCTKHVVVTLMQKVLELPDESFFYYNLDSNFESVLNLFSEDNEKDSELVNLFVQIDIKYQRAIAEAKQISYDVSVQLENLEPGAALECDHIKYVANMHYKNDYTILMIALQKKLAPMSIHALITYSTLSILKITEFGDNVFHFWARNLDFNTLQILEPLWLEYKARWQEVNLDINYLYSQNLESGNTFMHDLVSHPDVGLVNLAMARLFETSNDLRFHVPFLMINKTGKTPLDIIVERDIFPIEMQQFILTRISEVAKTIYVESEELAAIIFSTELKFFGEHYIAYINKLMTQENYLKLVEKVYINCAGRNAIIIHPYTQIAKLITPHKLQRADDFKKAMEGYLGAPEFTNLFDGKYLLSIIVEHLCKTNDKELEAFLDTELVRQCEFVIPINESLPWRRIKQQLANSSTEVINKALFKKYTERLRSRINIFDRHANMVPLDYAIQEADPLMVEFLVSMCGAEINDRILYKAITQAFILTVNTDENLIHHYVKVAEFLYERANVKSNPNRCRKLGVLLYNVSCISPGSAAMNSWLLKHNFPYDTANPDGTSIVHKILEKCSENNATQVYALLFSLFTDKNQATTVLNQKSNLGHTCVFYLFNLAFQKKISTATLYELLELFIKHGAILSDCGMKGGKSVLHCALILKDAEILKLILHTCKTADVLKLINTIDQKTNMSILQSTAIAAAKDHELNIFHEVLQTKIVSLTSTNSSKSNILKLVVS